ncbi:ATP-binding cassette domain-containing protein, partial [archaeon]
RISDFLTRDEIAQIRCESEGGAEQAQQLQTYSMSNEVAGAVLKLLHEHNVQQALVEHHSLHDVICDLYANTDSSQLSTVQHKEGENVNSSPPRQPQFPYHCYIEHAALRNLLSLLYLRAYEIRDKWRVFGLVQVLLPMLLVWSIAFYCSDVRFPKIAIDSSYYVEGLGEVLVYNDHQNSSLGIASLVSNDSIVLANGLDQAPLLPSRLQSSPTDFVYMDGSSHTSSEVYDSLYANYFNSSHIHYGALVLDDYVEDFIETSLSMYYQGDQQEMEMLLLHLHAVHSEICHSNGSASDASKYGERFAAIDESYELVRGVQYCDTQPRLVIQMYERHKTKQDKQQDKQQNKQNKKENTEQPSVQTDFFDAPSKKHLLVLRTFRSVRTDITLLTNVTADHAAPIFLKEVVYPLLLANDTQASVPTDYQLFSYPLVFRHHVNKAYLERGFMGSLLVLMLVMLVTVPSIKYVVRFNAVHVKPWLLTASLRLWQYLVGNFLFDFVLLFISLASIAIAIMLGDDPVSSFYVYSGIYHNAYLLSSMLAYAASIIAANYTVLGLADDALMAQLLVLVSNVLVVFLKLFLDQYNAQPVYARLGDVFTYLSPSFAFVSAVFELFKLFSRDAVVAHDPSALITEAKSRGLRKIRGLICIMLIQAMAYALLYLALNTWLPIVHAYIRRWRFYFAAEDYGSISIKEEDISAALGASTSTSSIAEREMLVQFARTVRSKLVALRVKRSETMHDRYGVFPELDRETYALALEAHRTLSEATPLLSRTREASRLPHPPTSVVEATDLTVAYSASDSPSLSHVSFSLQKGERVAVMGMNGSGKSTLFRCLTGQLSPSSGDVRIAALSPSLDLWLLHAQALVSYMPQEGGLPDFLTVREALCLLASLRLPDPLERAAYLERVAYTPLPFAERILPARYLDYPLCALSGGTRKKAEGLAALIGHPSLLLVDECTTGVDPLAAAHLVSYFAHAHTQTHAHSMVFTSHRVDECLRLCTRVMMLAKGRVVLADTPQAFQQLAAQFFQVDVVLQVATEGNWHGNDGYRYGYGHGMDAAAFIADVMRSVRVERCVEYAGSKVRFVFDRAACPLHSAHALFEAYRAAGRLCRYGVRSMDMEEVLRGLM